MMVSVVFLRFSGKARSIVVWTTGGSSWCPAVGGEQRQPSAGLRSQHQSLISPARTWARQTALALPKGCRFSWDAQRMSQLQPASSVPREQDLEQQQPAEEGRGQGPLLSARSGRPDPAPLGLPDPDPPPSFPNMPMQPSHLRQQSQSRLLNPAPACRASCASARPPARVTVSPASKGPAPGEGTRMGCNQPQARVTAVPEGESQPPSHLPHGEKQVVLPPQKTPAARAAPPQGTLRERGRRESLCPLRVCTY